MATSENSRAAFRRMNQKTFKGAPGGNGCYSAQANAKAFKEMSLAERETGMTVEQLAEHQRHLKDAFYERLAEAA